MSPGKVATHVHDIRGRLDLEAHILDPPEVMKESKCTTMNVSPDYSNYWAPAMYYIHPNGAYSLLQSDTVIYYAINGPANAFPPGFRRISGLANTRDIGAIPRQGIEWHINGNGNAGTGKGPPANWNRDFMPNGTNSEEAPETIIIKNHFPSCGNGSLDSADHFSHMTWPVTESSDGVQSTSMSGVDFCPDSHPIKYPVIHHGSTYALDEYQRQNWRKGEANLVLANGDTTGTTFHSDFVSAWDYDLLQKALQDPTCLDGDSDSCPVLRDIEMGEYDFEKCRLEGQIVAEDVGLWTPLEKLPGANGTDPKNMGGCDNTLTCPVFTTWATWEREKIDFVQTGTQKDVDEAAKNGAGSRVNVPGLSNDSPYSALDPPTSYENVVPSQVITMTAALPTFSCRYNDPEKYLFGMPCGPTGVNTDAEATSTPTQNAARRRRM